MSNRSFYRTIISYSNHRSSESDAVDWFVTELPVPPERTHLMLDSRASWVSVQANSDDKQFDVYPDESIAAWHQRLGVED